MFKTFRVEVENQLNKRIKSVRSDHGGESYGDLMDQVNNVKDHFLDT